MLRMTGAFCLALTAHFVFFGIPTPVEEVLPVVVKKVERISLQLRVTKVSLPKGLKKTPRKISEKKIKKKILLPKRKTVKKNLTTDLKKINKDRRKKRVSIPLALPSSKPWFSLSEDPKEASMQKILEMISALTQPMDLKERKSPEFETQPLPVAPRQEVPPRQILTEDYIASLMQSRSDEASVTSGILPLALALPILSENIRIAAMQPPRYPRAARRQGREGIVKIKVEILADGSLGKLEIYNSSGSKDLDQSAIDAVAQWHFRPATHAGSAVVQTAIFPVRFTLK